MDGQELPRYRCHKEVWALKIKSILIDGHGEDIESDGSATIIPENEDYVPFKVTSLYMHKHKPEIGGYYVRYKDGYESFSPADVFEDGYSPQANLIGALTNTNLDFGSAIRALKQGKRVSRAVWNGKGLFIFMLIPSSIEGDIVPKMLSLPQSVKHEFERRFKADRELRYISFKNQLAMVYPDNTIYGWVASPSDVLEEDWCILD